MTSPPTGIPPGRLPSPQGAREGDSHVEGNTPASDSPLPLRLRDSLQHWSFAPPMAPRVIRKGLTWKWVNKPPALSRPPPSTYRGTLTHHISRLLAERIIAEVATPTEMLSVPSLHRPKDFRLGRGESGHRPLFPQPSHSRSHLLEVHSLEAAELGPQRRPLHLHRHIRRLPPHPHPHALPEVPCLQSRRQALLHPSHAIRDKHRPSHFSP